MEEGDGAQHHKYKQDAGDVHAGHQLGQGNQRPQPIVAHSVRHRAECPQRRRLHDESDHAEHQVGDFVASRHQRLALSQRS